MKKLSTAIKYAVFAGMATFTNISIQRISLEIYSEKHSLYIAMFLGTFFGLLVKYILDKRYIFYYKVKTKQDDIFKFILYSFMGLFTTLIFWGTEILFDLSFPFDEAKFIGAVLGLTAGYTAKYFLDKRFVFRLSQP